MRVSSQPLVDMFGEGQDNPRFPQNQPDFYFETPAKVPFKKANETVATEGILSPTWKSKRLDRLEIGECGAYFAWALRDRPHCQQPRSQRQFIKKCALERGINEVNHIPYSKACHVDVGNLVVFNGHSSEFQDAIRPHVEALSLRSLKEEFKEQHHRQHTASDRGNKTRHAGFAAQNQKLDDDFGVTAPQIVAGTNEVEVRRMIALSAVMRTLSETAGFECPFSNNPIRNKRFAQYLVEEFNLDGVNLIEHKTAALTSASPDRGDLPAYEEFTVGAHLDKLNCPLPNWDIVFTLYFHFYDREEHRWFRVAEINYSRACANSFLVRLNSADFLLNNLVLYYNSPTNLSRRKVDDPLSLLPPAAEDGTVVYRHSLPIFDKAMGFLSSFATIVYRASKLDNMNLERMCEVVLPIMWLTSPVNYYLIYDQWIRRDRILPEGNLSLAFIAEMIRKHGGINAGSGARYTPSFTFSITEEDLFKALNVLRGVILDVNTSEPPPSRRKVVKDLKGIIGVRELGAQHAIAVLTMSGVMRIVGDINPAVATVCKGTLTFDTLSKVYGMSEAVANATYSRAAERMETSTKVVENVGCEYVRETAKELLMATFDEEEHRKQLEERGGRRPDTYFSNQMMFLTLTEGMVKAISRESPPFGVSHALLPSAGDVTWIRQLGRPKLEVKISTGSRLRSAGACKDKKKKSGRIKKLPKQRAIGVLPDRARKININNEKVRRSYEDDEDPELAFEMNVSKEEVLRLCLGNRRTTRNSTSLSLETIMSATRNDMTYRYFDPQSICLSIVAHDMQRTGKRKRAKQYFKTSPHYFEDYCETLFTAELRYDVHIYLSCRSDKSLVPPLGYVRYHNGRAYYRTRKLALRALYINILVREAGRREGCLLSTAHPKGDVDPMWSKNALPNDRIGKPNDFVVLYEKRLPSDVLIGCLFFKGSKRILSVPTNIDDLSVPWYPYTLSGYVG